MKARRMPAIVLALFIGAIGANVAVAQLTVSVQNPSIAWTGKTGQDANYRWSATVTNPSSRELNVRVTIELLDADGMVVAHDSTDVMLPEADSASVERTASVAVATAETATQYRVVLAEIE